MHYFFCVKCLRIGMVIKFELKNNSLFFYYTYSKSR